MLTLFLTSLHPLTLPLQGQSGPLKRGETHTFFLEDLRAHFVSWCSSGARSPYCFCDCHKGFRSIARVSILCLLCQMHQYMVLLRQAVHVLTCIHCSPSIPPGLISADGRSQKAPFAVPGLSFRILSLKFLGIFFWMGRIRNLLPGRFRLPIVLV